MYQLKLSILQQTHINHSLSTSPAPDVPCIVNRPPVFPCAKLKMGVTAGSVVHVLNGSFLTGAYEPSVWGTLWQTGTMAVVIIYREMSIEISDLISQLLPGFLCSEIPYL
jgi:hypothetical protein